MKTFCKTILPVVLILFVASCGNGDTGVNSEPGEKNNHESHNNAKAEAGNAPAASVQLKDDKLNAVYQHYVHLTTALTNGDMAEAKIASNAIEAGAAGVAGAETIAASAGKITNATDIEVQRTAYAALSDNFITLVKKSGLNSGELYVDFCPMAMNDQGASWISADKEIRNPYFGDKMMSCGEIKETIQ